MLIRDGLYAELSAWSRLGYPHEVVALLLGRVSDADVIAIELFVPVANQAVDTTTQFVLDPQGWLVADAQAQSLDLEIVGMVHSHPDAVPYPSVADVASADLLGTRFAYLVIAVDAIGDIAMTAWRWDGQSFCEQRLECR
jgi:proteasome lid subunit RPN8/RPN11